jgi:hypothetical protein
LLQEEISSLSKDGKNVAAVGETCVYSNILILPMLRDLRYGSSSNGGKYLQLSKPKREV